MSEAPNIQDVIRAIEDAAYTDEELYRIGRALAYRKDVKRQTQRSTIKVGDAVRLTDQVRPIYMQGRTAKVVQVNRTRFVIVLDVPAGRFHGRVTVPMTLIEKIED